MSCLVGALSDVAEGLLSHAAVAKASGISLGVIQFVTHLPGNPVNPADNQLSNPVAPLNGERLFAEVDEGHLYLTPVVTINSSGAIDNGQAMGDGKTAASPDLPFIARRDRHSNASGHKDNVQPLQQTDPCLLLRPSCNRAKVHQSRHEHV